MPAVPLLARPTLSFLPKGLTLGQAHTRPEGLISSGNPALDRLLGGGLPRGRLSEVCGSASSGRTSLAYWLLAAATRRSEIVALVDGRDRFDPRCAAAVGMDLSRLLWVRPPDEREALRASEILLGTRGLGLVLLDFADGLSPLLAARFTSAWPRLARQAAAANVTFVMLSRRRLAGSFAALCLELRGTRSLWPKHALRASLFAGIATRVEVVRKRDSAPGARYVELRP
jgi:recombination protein RecA